jgi:hypothetical protein
LRTVALDRFSAAPGPSTAVLVALAGGLAPSSADERAGLDRLVERAAAQQERPEYKFARYLARHRSGDGESLALALETSLKADAAGPYRPARLALLALSYRRQGRDDEAKTALAGADREFGRAPTPSAEAPLAFGSLLEELVFLVLRREAGE